MKINRDMRVQLREVLIEFARYQGAIRDTDSPSHLESQIDKFITWYMFKQDENITSQEVKKGD